MKHILLTLSVAFTLSACTAGGLPGAASPVNYSKVRTEQIEAASAVALAVNAAEGKQGKEWRKARREIGTFLSSDLTVNQLFQDIRNEGDDADYRLNVVVTDIVAGQEQLGSVVAYGSAAPAGIKAIDAVNDRQEAYEVREVTVRVALLDADGGKEITAFTTSAAGGNTEETASRVVQRISRGLRCSGEGCA